MIISATHPKTQTKVQLDFRTIFEARKRNPALIDFVVVGNSSKTANRKKVK